MTEFKHQKARVFSELISDTFLYVRTHYKSLAKHLAILVLPFYMIQVFLLQDYTLELYNNILNGGEAEMINQLFSLKYLSSIGLTLMTISILTAVSIRHVSLTFHNEELSLQNFLAPLTGNVFSIIGLYAVMLSIFALSAFLFLIPGIYFGIVLCLAPAVMVIEKKNLLEAILASRFFIKDYWWYTFGVYILMFIITLISSSILTLPFQVISRILSADAYASIEPLLTVFIAAAASLFYSAIHIALAIHYLSLKELKKDELNALN